MRATMMAGLVLAAALAVLATPAGAQTGPGARADRAERAAERRPRIRVSPNQRLVRECNAWLSVEQRATGPTIVPNQHCWWAYR